MADQQNQTVLDLPKVVAVGVASPAAGAITSSFGVAGTLIGMALSAVVVTAVTDILKVYLARAPGAVTTIPGGFKKRSRWRNVLSRLRLPFSKFWSLPPARRRSLLIGSLATSVISLLIGIGILTGVEVGVGKSLSCWIWDECPTEESSASGGGTSRTSTLGALFNGGPTTQAPSPEQPSGAKQGLPSQQDLPSQQEATPGSEVSPPPGQRESPSGIPVDPQATPPSEEGERPQSEGAPSRNGRSEPPAIEEDGSNP